MIRNKNIDRKSMASRMRLPFVIDGIAASRGYSVFFSDIEKIEILGYGASAGAMAGGNLDLSVRTITDAEDAANVTAGTERVATDTTYRLGASDDNKSFHRELGDAFVSVDAVTNASFNTGEKGLGVMLAAVVSATISGSEVIGWVDVIVYRKEDL